MYSWNNRFDDSKRRFRSIYGARSQETALRELLADLRPNTGAIQRFIEKFGPTATNEIPTQPVTASWRRQHVLAQVTVSAAGVLIDLCDPAIRRDVEQAFSSVLAEYGVEHLDLSEMTSGTDRSRRRSLLRSTTISSRQASRFPLGWTARNASLCSKAVAASNSQPIRSR